MYCITLHLKRRIVYRCLALFLLISLLLHAFSLPQEREVWDEAYPHLVRGVHHLYCLALMALFSARLSPQASIGVVLAIE